MTPRSEIAIIIVSYNTRELLLECLASVIESVGDTSVEIVVVDNDSKDGSADVVRQSYPQISVIANRVNRGFGAACNQAIRATRSPFILLLNSDARLTQQSLRVLFETMELDESCGASGCRLTNDEGREMINTRNFLTPFNQAFELTGITKYIRSRHLSRTCSPKVKSPLADCAVDWIDGACLMLRRAALDDAGLFDEQFFMYSEDEDLCLRLRKRRWTVCYSAAAVAFHKGGGSSAENPEELLRHFYKSQMLFLYKHHSQFSVHLYQAAMLTVLSIKRLLRWVAADRSGSRDISRRLEALCQAYSSFRSVVRSEQTRN